MKKLLGNSIAGISVALAIVLVAVLSLNFQREESRIRAVQECLQVSKVTRTNDQDKSVIEEPLMYVTKVCLEEKGYIPTNIQ